MNAYHFTFEQLSKLLSGTIDMMIEYRDIHCNTEEEAKFSAISEMFEGLNAEMEMFVNGDCKGLSLQSLIKGDEVLKNENEMLRNDIAVLSRYIKKC